MNHSRIYGVFIIQIAWSMLSLDINQSLNISQDILLNVLEFKPSNIQERYISIELTLNNFNYTAIPLLTLSLNNQPTLSKPPQISSLISNFTDFYAYNNQLAQHTVIFDYQEMAFNTSFFIGILYENYSDSAITYNLKSQESSDLMCPNKCSGIGRGRCAALNNCACYFPYVGRDCGNRISVANLNKNVTVPIESSQRGYLEINNTQRNCYSVNKSSVILKCTWIGNAGMIYLGWPTSK